MSTNIWKSTIQAIQKSQKKAEIPISAARDLLISNPTEALEDLAEISSGLNLVEIVTPVNAAEEKARWLELAQKGCLTDPVFQYNTDLLQAVSAKMPRLETIRDDFQAAFGEPMDDSALKQITIRRFQEAEATVQVAAAILEQDIVKLKQAMSSIFPAVHPELVQAAQAEADRLKLKKEEPTKRVFALLSKAEQLKLQHLKLKAEEIREYFWEAAKIYGFEQTRPIEVSTSATSIDVRDKSSVGPIVVIPQDREVSGLKLLELIAHEIEGHWRDSENAQAILPLLGGGALKPSDETFYEGHAMALEGQAKLMFGGLPSETAKPWYILAIDSARKGRSFSETAIALYPQVRVTKKSDEEAYSQIWTTCLRVYRGLSNTADNSYGYALEKDQAYFAGQILANELCDNNLEHLLDFSTLSVSDLVTLATTFKIKPSDIKYRRRADVLTDIAEMLLARCD